MYANWLNHTQFIFQQNKSRFLTFILIPHTQSPARTRNCPFPSQPSPEGTPGDSPTTLQSKFPLPNTAFSVSKDLRVNKPSPSRPAVW